MICSLMKLFEHLNSIRADRFYLSTEMLTDACDRLVKQAARTEKEDKEKKAAVLI